MSKNKRIAIVSAMSALATVMMFIEFPIFPQASFLKFDPSEIVALITGFMVGPLAGVLVVLVKDVLFFFAKSGDIIGITMNFIAGASFVFLSTLWYKRKRTKRVAVISMAVATVVSSFVMLMLNVVVVPIYFKTTLEEIAGWAKMSVLQFLLIILAFNLIKFGSVSLITVPIYKRVSSFFKVSLEDGLRERRIEE